FNTQDPDSEVRMANALWLRNGIAFDDDFLNRGAEVYRSSLYNLDFGNPGAPQKINDWVNNATSGRIKSIVRQLDRSGVLVLTNAVYLKDKWRNPFSPEVTHPALFYLPDGSTIEVNMMAYTDTYYYREASDHKAVILPYRDRRSMVILLPSRNTD